MKNYVKVIVIVCITFVIGMIGFSVIAGVNLDNCSENNVDVVQLNDIRETARENWDNLQNMNGKDFGVDFVVLDNLNNILYTSTSVADVANLTVEDAVKSRYPYSYVTIDNRVAGCVIMIDSGEDAYISIKNRILFIYVFINILL